MLMKFWTRMFDEFRFSGLGRAGFRMGLGGADFKDVCGETGFELEWDETDFGRVLGKTDLGIWRDAAAEEIKVVGFVSL